MRLAWGNKVSPEFRERVFKICERFKWPVEQHANFLMACMAFESGETFSPKIKNAAGSGAIGLIQFMPATARGLSTTTIELEKMTAVEQLDFVEQYFLPYYKRISTLADMYMAILWPAHIGKPDDTVLFVDPNITYRQNSGLDKNKDGKITKSEAAAKVFAKLEKGLLVSNSIEINLG